MANFIELGPLLLLANCFLLIVTCSCQNIRVQVNNDKLQSAPYLIEAIRQIESQQQQHNNYNVSAGASGQHASASTSELLGNYSTILSHNPSTNQIVNIGSMSAHSSKLSSQQTTNNDNIYRQRTNNLHQTQQADSLALGSNDQIIESEPSNSKLATILGQPELIVAENLPQASRKRNQHGAGSANFGSSLGGQTVMNKPPVRAVPVTSSHLKRPFGLTFTEQSEQSPNQAINMGGASAAAAAASADQPIPPSSVSIASSQVIMDNKRLEFTQHNHHIGSSLVSPSVVSDESLAPHAIVKMHDVSGSIDGDPATMIQHDTESLPLDSSERHRSQQQQQQTHDLHDLRSAPDSQSEQRAAIDSWRSATSSYDNNDYNNHNNANSTRNFMINSPRLIYPKAPARSHNNIGQSRQQHSGRARVTVGAGNQLASSSSSTLALESHRSTDLSPTNYNHHDLQDMDPSLAVGGGSDSTNFQLSNGSIVVASNGMSDELSESNLLANETVDLSSADSNNNQPAGAADTSSAASGSDQPINSSSANQQQQNGRDINAGEQRESAMQRESSLQVDASYKLMNHSSLNHHSYQRQPQSSSFHQQDGMRVIEIPEKIVVSAGDMPHKNDDPIEIMPLPPAMTPIRLTINRTRLGKPDARCPREGVSTFEHPSACDKYYYCDDGYLIEQTCPNGLMYGTMYRIKDYCVYRWHADCVDKTIPNPISSPGCRWQYGVFSVQGSPKCTPDYYECIAGRFEVKKCSITGQVYDDRTKACQYAEKVGCPEEIISDFQCPTDDRSNSFWPFPRYYLDTKTIIHCVNDKPKIMRCPDGERVDLEHLYCIPMDSKEPVVMDRKVRERQKGTMQPQKNVS